MSSPEVFTGTDVDDKASVSSHEGDSPHKITGEWSDEIETICLHKGPEGLGFSLMHYKVCMLLFIEVAVTDYATIYGSGWLCYYS